jgi:hypothetical protein
MIELTERQTNVVHQNTPMMHDIHRAQLINAIEQAINGTWSTARLKACEAWKRIPEKNRAELSHLVDQWQHKASGNGGCDTPTGLKAYYKPEHGSSTPIATHKLVL